MQRRRKKTDSLTTVRRLSLWKALAIGSLVLPLLVGCPKLFEEAIPPRPAPIPTAPIIQTPPPAETAVAPDEPAATSTGQTQLSFTGLAGSSLRQFSGGLPTGRQSLDGVDFLFGDLFLQLRS